MHSINLRSARVKKASPNNSGIVIAEIFDIRLYIKTIMIVDKFSMLLIVYEKYVNPFYY